MKQACRDAVVVYSLFFSPTTYVFIYVHVYVVVNFSSQVIFAFLLFLGMAMHANEVKTKEKLPEMKN